LAQLSGEQLSAIKQQIVIIAPPGGAFQAGDYDDLLLYDDLIGVVTSCHMTKMAVTLFDLP